MICAKGGFCLNKVCEVRRQCQDAAAHVNKNIGGDFEVSKAVKLSDRQALFNFLTETHKTLREELAAEPASKRLIRMFAESTRLLGVFIP